MPSPGAAGDSVSPGMLLENIKSPDDVRRLSYAQLATLASEIRTFIVNSVAVTGGHLGSNLGVVELTFALHRVFDSPRDLGGADAARRVVAVIGDGSMTGGMAYEALNNLGHSGRRVVIVLNDNGRSYAPTISRLSTSVTRLRANPSYVRNRDRVERALRDVPWVGEYVRAGVQGLRAAFREVLEPKNFFTALGVRYV